jgi:hypothetical protein
MKQTRQVVLAVKQSILGRCLWDLVIEIIVYTREVLHRGRLSTVDLLVLTSLDHLLFIQKILLRFLTKKASLVRRSTLLSHPPQLVFSVYTYTDLYYQSKHELDYLTWV